MQSSVREIKARKQGFSLIELMVVVAIIGILVAIALPGYQAYVTRSKITDATSALANKRVQMEQYFQDNRTYVGANATNFPCAADTTTSTNFNFACVGLAATTYTIQANGKSTMADFAFDIDQNNLRRTTAAKTGWNTGNCWLVSKGATC